MQFLQKYYEGGLPLRKNSFAIAMAMVGITCFEVFAVPLMVMAGSKTDTNVITSLDLVVASCNRCITESIEEYVSNYILQAPKSLETTNEISQDDCNPEPQALNEISEDDHYLLAQILTAETGGEDEEEMFRVGTVFLNRINTTYWEFEKCTDFKSTLLLPGAYPVTAIKIQNGLAPTEKSLEISTRLIAGERTPDFGDDVFWQTGTVTDFNAVVVFVSPMGHYYSVLGS